MRKLICMGFLLLLVAAVGLGLYMGLTRDVTPPSRGSSAALGLMLLEKEEGLYVLAVTQGSPADRSGVQPGDYLVSSGEAPLESIQQLDTLLGAGSAPLLLMLNRDGQKQLLQLPAR